MALLTHDKLQFVAFRCVTQTWTFKTLASDHTMNAFTT